jgi:hypothetical protein
MKHETVAVFLAVSRAGEGSFSFAPYFSGVVDEFAASIATEFPMKLQSRDRDGVFDAREGLECPCMGLVEEGI